jgi:hypothetical protein
VKSRWESCCAGKVSTRPIWPASGRQVKEGALQRLSAKPGKKQGQVDTEVYDALKRELLDKERAMADQSVELAMLRKKTNGGSWDR